VVGMHQTDSWNRILPKKACWYDWYRVK